MIFAVSGGKKAQNIFFALVWLVFSLIIFGFITFSLNAESSKIEDLTPQTEASFAELSAGETVLLEARVDEGNHALVHDFVLACKEVFVDDDENGSWDTVREYNQSLRLRLGDSVFEVSFERACPRGDHDIIEDPLDDDVRWIGIRAGALLSVVGSVKSTAPLSVSTDQFYVGDVESYRKMLSNAGLFVTLFALLFIGIGVALLWRAIRS